jgi:hypothetical protein
VAGVVAGAAAGAAAGADAGADTATVATGGVVAAGAVATAIGAWPEPACGELAGGELVEPVEPVEGATVTGATEAAGGVGVAAVNGRSAGSVAGRGDTSATRTVDAGTVVGELGCGDLVDPDGATTATGAASGPVLPLTSSARSNWETSGIDTAAIAAAARVSPVAVFLVKTTPVKGSRIFNVSGQW